MKALSEFTSLGDARDYFVPKSRLISPDYFGALLGQFGLVNFLLELTDDKARMLVIRLHGEGGLNFNSEHPVGAGNLAYIAELAKDHPEHAVALTLLQDACVAYCVVKEYPYEHTTQVEYNRASNRYSEIVCDWPNDGIIKITVEGLTERSQALVYGVSEDSDEDENLCKPFWLTTKGKSKNLGTSYDRVKVRIYHEGLTITQVI